MAKALASTCRAPVVASITSRLRIDLNRSIGHPVADLPAARHEADEYDESWDNILLQRPRTAARSGRSPDTVGRAAPPRPTRARRLQQHATAAAAQPPAPPGSLCRQTPELDDRVEMTLATQLLAALRRPTFDFSAAIKDL
jgi:hypothetical protein